MKASECFQKRLLRRTKPDPLKVTKALEMSEVKRQRAQDLFENDFFKNPLYHPIQVCSKQLVASCFTMESLKKKPCLCRRIPQRTLFINVRAG